MKWLAGHGDTRVRENAHSGIFSSDMVISKGKKKTKQNTRDSVFACSRVRSDRHEKNASACARHERGAETQRPPRKAMWHTRTHVRSTGTAAACASVREKLTCTVAEADAADMAGGVCDDGVFICPHPLRLRRGN